MVIGHLVTIGDEAGYIEFLGADPVSQAQGFVGVWSRASVVVANTRHGIEV